MDDSPTKSTPRKSHLWERSDFDWYVEPTRATEQLLAVEHFEGSIWDPACGGGNIVKTCIEAGYDAIGTDILRRVDDQWFVSERDFLSTDRVMADNIVTNPPYFRAKGTEAFIKHALKLCAGKVCIFADIRFLAGAERANGIYREHPPNRIWIITPRVSCPPGEYLMAGNKAGNGSSDYCWLIWNEREHRSADREFGWMTSRNELQPQQVKLARLLVEKGSFTHEQAWRALYGADGKGMEYAYVLLKNRVHHMRHSLKAHQIKIETIWGVGYRVDEDSRDRLSKFMEENYAEAMP